MPKWWTELDLSRSRKGVPATAITSYIRKSRGTIRRAILNQRALYSKTEVLNKITGRCKDLRYLEITNGFAGSSIKEALPTASKLTTIILSEDTEVTLDTVTQLLLKCKHLERAEFGNIWVESNAKWPETLPPLKVLGLTCCKKKPKIARSLQFVSPGTSFHITVKIQHA